MSLQETASLVGILTTAVVSIFNAAGLLMLRWGRLKRIEDVAVSARDAAESARRRAGRAEQEVIKLTTPDPTQPPREWQPGHTNPNLPVIKP